MQTSFFKFLLGVRIRVVSVIALVLLTNVQSGADDKFNISECSATTSTVDSKHSAVGPYCGINCLFAAMVFDKKDVSLKDFIKPEYVPSKKGSSLASLAQAAMDHGMDAIPIRNMSCDMLRKSPYRIILHVKKNIEDPIYNHYELFLGNRNGRALMYDSANRVYTESFARLAARWNGSGLVISTSPIRVVKIFSSAYKAFFAYFVISLLSVAIIIRFERKYKLYGTEFQLTSIVFISALAAIFYNCFGETGLYSAQSCVPEIHYELIGHFLPTLDLKDMSSSKEKMLIIDARYESDYRLAHIPGAINIPIDRYSEMNIRGLIGDQSTNPRITVYCQSRMCKYGEEVATYLYKNGYRNITLFPGGWTEWKNKYGGIRKK